MNRERLGTGFAAVCGILVFGTCACGTAADKTPRQPPPTSPPAPAYRSIVIRDVPHVVQRPDFCGEAAATMWLQKLGRNLTQDDVFNASGLDPLEGRGCYTKELARALVNLGFQPGPVWYPVTAAGAAEQVEKQWQALHADLLSGVPSIVCMYYDTAPRTTEHFRLILGYDASNDTVIYHEPALARAAYQHMPRATFLSLWPLKGERQSTVIRMRLEATRDLVRAAPARTAKFTAADYAQHLLKLKNKIPTKNFTVVITPPFVVIGDDAPDEVRRRSAGTVKWAVEKLKEAYFTKDPEEILDIWLFKDKESYEKHCLSIFKKKPDTPYGYYSHADRALVMNIATGGGTLVHEIVHPFMAANFPDCPAWFNEGMGSLYEQCGEESGRIHGYPNWRLPGLQEAVKKKTVPPFKTLMAMNETDFYEKDGGTNYSQSRYLCYYLQQRNLLRKFYQQFLANHEKDPGGYETLKAVLGREDMTAFQKEWQAWVLKLRR
jgi:hypothetical protein